MIVTKTLSSGNHLDYKLMVLRDGTIDIPKSVVVIEREHKRVQELPVSGESNVLYVDKSGNEHNINILDFDYIDFCELNNLQRTVRTKDVMASLIGSGIDRCRIEWLEDLDILELHIRKGTYKVSDIYHENWLDYGMYLESEDKNHQISTCASTLASAINGKLISCKYAY